MQDVSRMTNEELLRKFIGSYAVSVVDAGPIPPLEKRQKAAEGHKKIKAELLARLSGERWVRVEDGLPKSREWVIGCIEHDGKRHTVPVFGVRLSNDSNRFRWESEFPVVMWQPLPAPPSEPSRARGIYESERKPHRVDDARIEEILGGNQPREGSERGE